MGIGKNEKNYKSTQYSSKFFIAVFYFLKIQKKIEHKEADFVYLFLAEIEYRSIRTENISSLPRSIAKISTTLL